MPVDPNDMNEIRVDVLGTSVDKATTWISAGPLQNRNVLDPLITDRVPTRVLNSLFEKAGNADIATNEFAARFSAVVGEESGADQAEFDALGKNLIQVITDLVAGAGGSFVHAQPTPLATWSITHNLGRQYVAVQTVNDAGDTIIGDPDYTSANQVILTFCKAVAGTAVIRR